MFTNVVFGPTVTGLAPSEVNDLADNSLRRLRAAFCNIYKIAGNVTGTGMAYHIFRGKILLKKPVPLQRRVTTTNSCETMVRYI